MTNWDKYFMGIAKQVSTNTKCLSRQIGAVLVRDKFIVSTGYNGPPIGIKHCPERYPNSCMLNGELACPRRTLGFISGEGLHMCPASHAERNAMYTAARMGHPTEGCILYIYSNIPVCIECAKGIIMAGIKEVVISVLGDYEVMGLSGQQLLEEAEVIIRKPQEDVS